MIHIKEPYWSAGTRYGWEGERAGIGINVKYFNGEGMMKIMIGQSSVVYSIPKNKARDFVKKHNSFDVRGSTTLGVIPIHILDKEEEERPDLQQLPL